jgi:hypothetical protein
LLACSPLKLSMPFPGCRFDVTSERRQELKRIHLGCFLTRGQRVDYQYYDGPRDQGAESDLRVEIPGDL